MVNEQILKKRNEEDTNTGSEKVRDRVSKTNSASGTAGQWQRFKIAKEVCFV